MNAPSTTWGDSDKSSWAPPLPASAEVAPGVDRTLAFAYGCAAFLIGLVRSWTIQLVGAMPVGELILLAVVGHAILWMALTSRLPAPLPAPRLLAVLAFCQGLALISYIVTDLWRESAPVDMIRGWLRMIFVLIDLGGLALLLGATERTFAFLQLGASFSFLQLLITPPTFGEYWKFGFAYPVTTFALLLAPRFLGYWAALLSCLALGVLNAFMDFRSLGAICLGIGGLLAIRALPRTARKALMIVGALGVLALSPWFFQKMFADTDGRANRSNVERLAMLAAAWEGFAESPLIGQGSWFSKSDLMDNFLLIRSDKAHAAGGGMQFKDDDFEGVSIHSQLLVTLAEGGIFGGLFFFAYGFGIVWAMWFALGDAAWHWTLPSRVFILATSFWDLWMSPFSGPVRVNIALTAILIALFWRQRIQRRGALSLSRA
jgi:hypothetical protein